MGTTERLSSRSARALGVALLLVAAAGLVSSATDGVGPLLDYCAPLVALGLLGWAAFWRPCIEVSDGGVEVRNTLRTVHVPWPAIDSVEGRYGLRLRTAYGSVTAWAAAAPSGRQRARVQESTAAALVNARLEELRSAGHLDDRRLESPRLRVTWHRELVAALVFLAVATVVLPLLG
jgi:PH (Pleckstrin Homology) domain-containing protein